MLQAPQFDGPSLDPFSLQQDGLAAPEVDVGWGEIVEALVVAPMIVVVDEGGDLGFEITRQEVVLQQDAVLQRLVPALDLALGLRIPSRSSVRRAGKWDRFTIWMISSFSEAAYLIRRRPHPRSCFF